MKTPPLFVVLYIALCITSVLSVTTSYTSIKEAYNCEEILSGLATWSEPYAAANTSGVGTQNLNKAGVCSSGSCAPLKCYWIPLEEPAHSGLAELTGFKLRTSCSRASGPSSGLAGNYTLDSYEVVGSGFSMIFPTGTSIGALGRSSNSQHWLIGDDDSERSIGVVFFDHNAEWTVQMSFSDADELGYGLAIDYFELTTLFTIERDFDSVLPMSGEETVADLVSGGQLLLRGGGLGEGYDYNSPVTEYECDVGGAVFPVRRALDSQDVICDLREATEPLNCTQGELADVTLRYSGIVIGDNSACCGRYSADAGCQALNPGTSDGIEDDDAEDEDEGDGGLFSGGSLNPVLAVVGLAGVAFGVVTVVRGQKSHEDKVQGRKLVKTSNANQGGSGKKGSRRASGSNKKGSRRVSGSGKGTKSSGKKMDAPSDAVSARSNLTVQTTASSVITRRPMDV